MPQEKSAKVTYHSTTLSNDGRKSEKEGEKKEKKADKMITIIDSCKHFPTCCLMCSILNWIHVLNLWVMLQYRLIGGFERFGGTYCHHFQGLMAGDVDSMFLRNVGTHLPDYMVS
jgi:hypothetical protein